jgi:hypothetical protein
MTFNELNAVFSQCNAIGFKHLDGHYAGTALGLPGLNRLPSGLRSMLTALINQPWVNFLWKGKYFSAGQGCNLWFSLSGKRVFAHYRYYTKKDGAFILDYNVEANPSILRTLSAELRGMNPIFGSGQTLYLGRVMIAGQPKMFFTLSDNSGVASDGL